MENFWTVANFFLLIIQIVLFLFAIYELFSNRKENIKMKKIHLLERYMEKYKELKNSNAFLELKSDPETLNTYMYIKNSLEYFYFNLNLKQINKDNERNINLFYASLIDTNIYRDKKKLINFLNKYEKFFIKYMKNKKN